MAEDQTVPTIPTIPLEAFPPNVTTAAQRERWELSRAIAARFSALYEEDGTPDSIFVLNMTRVIYESDLETGEIGDTVGELQEAVDLDDPADKLWAELEATKPADDVDDPEVHWAHVGKVADLFDELFGDPDEIDFGDEKLGVPPPGRGLSLIESEQVELEELFAHVFHGVYRKELHPRDRLGKWAEKLNGVRAFAAKHREHLREHVAASVAAAALRHEVRTSDKRGGELHGDVTKAHMRHDDHAARLKAHAREQRAREGISGARQVTKHQARRAKGHALTSLAYLYSEEAARKSGKLQPFHEEMTSDTNAVVDEVERAKTVKEMAHEAARYGVEHRHEIHHVIRVVKHVAHAGLRAKGLAHSDADEDDEAAAELILADVAE